MQIPDDFVVECVPDGVGWSFEVSFRDGASVSSGWTNGDREEALQMAYESLEQQGLIDDGEEEE